MASHAFAIHAGWNRRFVLKYETRTESSDQHDPPTKRTIRTNEIRIASGDPPPPLSELPEDAPGDNVEHNSAFWMRGSSRALADGLNVLAYASLVGIAQAVHFQRRSRERERRANALEAQLAEARLSVLQAQLQPHFLFNALNAISTLLRRDPRAAQDALASFSDLLRLALSQSKQPEVPLSENLRFLRHYVEIQKMRLGGTVCALRKTNGTVQLMFPPNTTPLFLDYDDFHPRSIAAGKNVVYMDGHVTALDVPTD